MRLPKVGLILRLEGCPKLVKIWPLQPGPVQEVVDVQRPRQWPELFVGPASQEQEAADRRPLGEGPVEGTLPGARAQEQEAADRRPLGARAVEGTQAGPRDSNQE